MKVALTTITLTPIVISSQCKNRQINSSRSFYITTDCKEPLVLITEPRCDITCYNVQYPQSCVDVEGFEPSCGCKEGYVIDESSGICIPIDQCQKCYKEDGTPVNPGFSYMKSHCEEWYVIIRYKHWCKIF